MKTRGFWLGRQQMRWLIVLLALMPLVPTGIIVRDLIKSGQDEREFAVAVQMEAERLQLVSITNRISEKAIEPLSAEAFRTELIRIFGEDSHIVIWMADGTSVGDLKQARFGELIETEIAEGRLAGWRVTLERKFEAPYFLEEQLQNRWWQAIGIMGGVTLAAAAIWWTVNRGLRVDELRSDLLATLAHEMKTPLSSMRVLLETLSAGTISGAEKQEEYLDLLQRENARLSRLTEDFLTFGRLERGEIRLKTEDVPVKALVADAIEELGPAAAAVTATIRSKIDPALAVRADRDGLFAVITNLIENSLKYGGIPPEIMVGAESDGETVALSVSDSGPGIPRELRKAIFRRYFRIDRRLSEQGSGVGLGLAICRQLVRKMGGRIRAESTESGGRGLRVVLTLPAGTALELRDCEEVSDLEPSTGTAA